MIVNIKGYLYMIFVAIYAVDILSAEKIAIGRSGLLAKEDKNKESANLPVGFGGIRFLSNSLSLSPFLFLPRPSSLKSAFML